MAPRKEEVVAVQDDEDDGGLTIRITVKPPVEFWMILARVAALVLIIWVIKLTVANIARMASASSPSPAPKNAERAITLPATAKAKVSAT